MTWGQREASTARTVKADGRQRGKAGLCCDHWTEHEELTSARTAKPNVRNNDRRSVPVAVWRTIEHSDRRRSPIELNGPFRRPKRDHDPSRGAVGHGIDGFVRRAWHARAVSPGSVAEPPFAPHGGLRARRFRRSKSGPDRSLDRRGPDNGSERTRTSCTTPHRYTRQCQSGAPCAGIRCLSIAAILALRPATFVVERWHCSLTPPSTLSCDFVRLEGDLKLRRARLATTCGYVDNATALPTYPQPAATNSDVNLNALTPARSDPDHHPRWRRRPRGCLTSPRDCTIYPRILAAVHSCHCLGSLCCHCLGSLCC